MLNGIHHALTGDILKFLCDMGHGDELVIADANFPAASVAANGARLCRLPGLTAPQALAALLPLFPVDHKYTAAPVLVMERTKEDLDAPEPAAWAEFRDALRPFGPDSLSALERQAFYYRAGKAYLILQTGEERQYGNLILVKGCVL